MGNVHCFFSCFVVQALAENLGRRTLFKTRTFTYRGVWKFKQNWTYHFVRGDLAKLGEDLLELVLAQIFPEVLDVDVCELLGLLAQLLLALLARHEPRPDRNIMDADFFLMTRILLINSWRYNIFVLKITARRAREKKIYLWWIRIRNKPIRIRNPKCSRGHHPITRQHK